jgi:DNA-binding HxlR family transcriptional regulator
MSTELDPIIGLARYRWMVPVLARMAARGGGARFAELAAIAGLSRESLSRTLLEAQSAGWVVRNCGHGHPLRPEYLLTDEGKAVAAGAACIDAVQMRLQVAPGSLTRWGLPAVRLIADGIGGFNELLDGLREPGPRALSLGLKALSAHELIRRELVDAHPPRSRYSATRRGARLADATRWTG